MVATSDAVARVRYVSLLTTAAMVAFAANSVLCRAALGGGEIDTASFSAIARITAEGGRVVRVRVRIDAELKATVATATEPCRAPRRHTMPSAQAGVKRGGGARRTSVSQSWKVTGHFFRLYLRPWCPGRGDNRRIH